MKKNKARKLQLRKSTIRVLDGPNVQQIAGGKELAPISFLCTISLSRLLCDTANCPVTTQVTCA